MQHKKHRIALAAILAALLSVVLYAHAEASALGQMEEESPTYEWTEEDAWQEWVDLMEKTPECRDDSSTRCKEIKFRYHCKYSGTSFYEYVCAGEKQLRAEVPLNEETEWQVIMESPYCIDEDSRTCRELKFRYACKYNGNSRNANLCAGIKLEKADEMLLDFYQSLLVAYKNLASQESHWSDLPNLLAASQDAWSAYREKECNFVEQYFKGGTLQPALWSDCMREESERRLRHLEKHAKEYEATFELHNISLQRDAPQAARP